LLKGHSLIILRVCICVDRSHKKKHKKHKHKKSKGDNNDENEWLCFQKLTFILKGFLCNMNYCCIFISIKILIIKYIAIFCYFPIKIDYVCGYQHRKGMKDSIIFVTICQLKCLISMQTKLTRLYIGTTLLVVVGRLVSWLLVCMHIMLNVYGAHFFYIAYASEIKFKVCKLHEVKSVKMWTQFQSQGSTHPESLNYAMWQLGIIILLQSSS